MSNRIMHAAGWLAVCALALWLRPAGADIITISNDPNGALGGGTDDGTEGQAFTPSVNDGYAGSPAVVYLQSIKFFSDWSYFNSVGPQNWMTNATVYLHIYTNHVNDGWGWNGYPEGFIGCSQNTFVFPSNAPAQAMTWTFSNVPLNYTQLYYALLSTQTTAAASSSGWNGLVGRWFTSGTDRPYAGGLQVWRGVHLADWDTSFVITMDTIPEPWSVALVGGGLAWLAVWRKRRKP